MMTSVFNAPSYQHMVNANKQKFYALQNDIPQTSILHQRNRLEVEPRCSLQILDKFLASSEPPPMPVVLRNKTTFTRFSPKIAVVPQIRADESNSMRFISKAYTLPHNTSTDVLELVPSGDLPDDYNNAAGLEMSSLPLHLQLMQRLKNIDWEDVLQKFLSSLKALALRVYNNSPIRQPMSIAYSYLADLLESFAWEESSSSEMLSQSQSVLIMKLKMLWQRILQRYINFTCWEVSCTSMHQSEYRRRMQQNAIVLQSGLSRRLHPEYIPTCANGRVPKVIVPPSQPAMPLQRLGDYQHLPLLNGLM